MALDPRSTLHGRRTAMPHQTTGRSPVDNATYNLLQALVSKLEAIEAYAKYQHDGDEELFGQLEQEERQHAQQLLQALRTRLGAQSDAMAGSAAGR
jgi:hypothetical protein